MSINCQGQVINCSPFRPCSCPEPIVTDIWGKETFQSTAEKEQKDFTAKTLASLQTEVNASVAAAEAAAKQQQAATAAMQVGQQTVSLAAGAVAAAFPPKTSAALLPPLATTGALPLVTPTDDEPAPAEELTPLNFVAPTPAAPPSSSVPTWVWVLGGMSVVALALAVV